MSTEVCFPRGGTEKPSKKTVFNEDGEISSVTNSSSKKTSSSATKSKSQTRPAGTGKIGKAKTFNKVKDKVSKSKTKQVEAADDATSKATDDAVTFVPARLSTKKVIKGSLLLGAIKEIRDYEIRLNLPNNLLGVASITDMSDGYTGLLKRFAQSDEDPSASEELHSLSEIFTVGQVIPCVCIEESKDDNPMIKLSINPKVLHENMSTRSLRHGFVLYGAVSGIEDHGCVIDIGLDGITAFMPLKGTPDLYVGMMRRFRVTQADAVMLASGEARTINVALQTGDNGQEEKMESKSLEFNSIIPGRLFEGKISACKREGLSVTYGSTKGYVHVTHLSKNVKEYTKGLKEKFRVLAVNTSTKYIHLTGLTSLLDYIDALGSGAVSVPLGEPTMITINKIQDKYAFMSTEDGQESYMGISLLPEKLQDAREAKRTKLKCYWYGWDYLEERPIITSKQPHLKKSILPTLTPGEFIEAKVESFGAQGAKVKLASGMYAFIQNIHLTEVPLKNPEKKIKQGQKLQCRILSVDMATKRVRLTCKPSLLNSDLQVISDIYDVKVGSLVQGVIVKLTTGALISFYNKVVGFVPDVHLAKTFIKKPSDMFYIGQSVTCRVLSCDPWQDKMALTFILGGEGPARRKRRVSLNSESEVTEEKKPRAEETTPKEEITSEVTQPERKRQQEPKPGGTPLSLGQVVGGWTVQSIEEEGNFRLLSDEGHQALLPKLEMSDFPGVSELLAKTISNGSKLDDLVCISEEQHIVSNKLMLKHFAAKDALPKNRNSIEVGQKCAGIVKSYSGKDMIVNLGSEIFGRSAHGLYPDGARSYLLPGRSVLVKVSSVDAQNKKIVLDMQEDACSVPVEYESLVGDMFTQSLRDLKQYRQWASQHSEQAGVHAAMCQYEVGQVVSGTVTHSDDSKIKATLDDGTKAVAVGSLTMGCKAKKGDNVTGVVMYVDMLKGVLDVILDDEYVSVVKQNQSKLDCNKARPGQKMNCEIVYTRPEYMLAMLKGHARGKLAYVSTFKHPNTMYYTYGAYYGQRNKAIIRKSDSNSSVIVAELQTDKALMAEKAKKIQTKGGLPATGSLVRAVISDKLDLQLNLKIGENAIGKVYINEVVDNPAHKSKPLAKYKPGQTVEVKVLGAKVITGSFRLKQFKDKRHDVMLDCSLRDSKMGPNETAEGHTADMQIGEQLTCYVIKYEMSQEKTYKAVHVLTSDGRPAVIDINKLGEPVDKSNLSNKFPPGICLKASVFSLASHGPPNLKVITNNIGECSGSIVDFDQSFGLTLSTPLNPNYLIPLSELSEPGEDVNMAAFTVGQTIKCRIAVKKRRSGVIVLTLREKGGIVSIGDLKAGQVLPAIVAKTTSTWPIVIAGGNKVTLNLSPKECKNFTKTHKAGKACWVTMISVGAAEDLQAVICYDEALIEKILADPETNVYTSIKGIQKYQVEESTEMSKKPKYQAEESTEMSKKPKYQAEESTEMSKKPQKAQKRKATTSGSEIEIKSEIKQEILDNDTGVHIVIKSTAGSGKRQALDFGASVQSLQREPEISGNSLDKRLDNLEQTGKRIRQSPERSTQASHKPEGDAKKLDVGQYQSDPKLHVPGGEAEYLLTLKSSPDDGKVWSKLIKYTSEHKGVEAARARAEQALQTVSYRMEHEKLIVWTAFLLLELMYGTEDSLDNVKRRALQQMNELKVYQELVKVYLSQDQTEEAEGCYTAMLRKWSDKPIVWTDYGQFLFTHAKVEPARTVLQRALKTLPTKSHIEVIMKFAQMELKDGHMDRFVSLFENVLTNFPKRNDVWSVYADQLIKYEHYDSARAVLRRAVMQKLNAKKIQFFISKFTRFESEHGTPETLAEVKELSEAVAK